MRERLTPLTDDDAAMISGMLVLPRRPTPGERANQWTINILRPLRAILPTWPPVLPSEVGDPIRPLKIGTHQDLMALLGPSPGKAHWVIANALRRYTASSRYRWALNTPSSWRHALDGTPIEPVAAEHKASAIEKPRDTAMTIEAKAIKVTVVLDGKALKPPQPGAPVVIEIKTPGGLTARANLNPKSYRKVIEAIRILGPENVVVLLQGQMVAPGEIIAAGISAKEKKDRINIEPEKAEA